MQLIKNRFFRVLAYLGILFSILIFGSDTQARVKIALWGDSRENLDNALVDIGDILLYQITDWDFQLHTGDLTSGGWEDDWQRALSFKGMDSLYVQEKFFMCTSNHDFIKAFYNEYTEGILPTNSANGTTHFYYHKQENVHVVACDAYFTEASLMQNWLDSVLVTIPPNDWLIGFWHDPCYEDITYKHSYLDKCGTWLESIFQYGGDFIFHGHAHIYVRTYPLLPDETIDNEYGMIHIVNGCGGASWEDPQSYTEHIAYTPDDSSFACITFITIDGDTALIQTIDARPGKNLEVFDEYKWVRERRYALEVNKQGSGIVTIVPNYNIFTEGTMVTLIASPDLGWMFNEWSGDFTGTENPKNINTVDSDMNVTAVFNAIPAGQYEMRITTSGSGSVTIDPPDNIYTEGTEVTLTAKPDSGYVLDYWGGELSGSGNPEVVVMDSHKNISAAFRPGKYYNLSVDIIGSGNMIIDPPGDTYIEGTVVTLTADPVSGWNFNRWSDNLSGSNNPEMIIIDSDKKITANFAVEGGIVVDLTPTDDSYVRGGSYADLNFNLDSTICVNEGDKDKHHRHTYLKFDLNSITGSVVLAVLKLKVEENGLRFGKPTRADVYSITDDNWKETEITWSNAPQVVNHLDSRADIEKENGVYVWNVTDFVSSEMDGDKIVSFMLKDDAELEMQVDFYSKEKDFPPLLTVITDTSAVNVSEQSNMIPETYRLYQNFPNPFNPSTKILYQLPRSGQVKLAVYDITGRMVALLVDEFQNAGTHRVVWETKDSHGQELSSGIYLCRLQVGSFTKTMKIMFMR